MRQSGFTMIELILVMTIIGILAVVAIPRFRDNQTFNSQGFYDETFAILRYGQKTAIAQRRNVCVGFTSSSVTLTIAPSAGAGIACTTNLVGPNGVVPYRVAARSDITFTPGVPTSFIFNSLGQASPVGQSFGVSGITKTITIDRETGYVHP